MEKLLNEEVRPFKYMPNGRPKSNSTVKSVYLDSSASSSMSLTEMQVLLEAKQKALQKPVRCTQIYFNVLVVGDSHLGKTSFIEACIASKFRQGFPELTESRVGQDFFTHYRVMRYDSEVRLHMTFTDSPGYSYNPAGLLRTLKAYVTKQVQRYEALKLSGAEHPDCRVHLCLYFVQGPSLKKADLRAMKALQKCVLLLPVLAKTDSYSTQEIKAIKHTISCQAEAEQIKFFDCKAALASKATLLNSHLGACPPFTLAAPWDFDPFRGRNAEAIDLEGSDFSLLVKLLISYFVNPAITSGRVLSKQVLLQCLLTQHKTRQTQRSFSRGSLELLTSALVRLLTLVFS
jgi:septin family protein